MPRRVPRGAWVHLLLAFGALTLLGAAPVGLLSHGTEERYWIGVLVPHPSDDTHVQLVLRVRQAGSDRWQPLGRFPARARGLAHHRQDLAVLLEDGQWMLVWENNRTPGSRPDRASRILALASEARTLWSLSEMPDPGNVDGRARLAIHRLEQGQWTHHAFVEPDVSPDQLLSLSVVQGQPVLAARLDEVTVRVLQCPPDQDWIEIARLTAPESVTHISLIDGVGRPTLWLAGEHGAGWLYFQRQAEWFGPVSLGEAPLERATHRSITFATGALRLLFLDDQGRIMERSYRTDGQPLGEARELPAVRAMLSEQVAVSEWIKLGAMILLTLLLIGMLRRGQLAASPKDRPPPLPAPLLPRLAGGLVDASPVLATMGYILWYSHMHPDLSAEALHASLQPMFQTSIAVYLLHTTLSEWVWGRTLGKHLFGLRVVMTDDQPPRPLAVFIRNLLRMVDFMIFPLLLVVFSPMRQRIGDVAAGTVVVRRTVAPPPGGQ